MPVADVDGLRPTADRIRETLFNWLQGRIHGSRCLDLFAGSGALGLEALSRGAGKVVFIEKSTAAAQQIGENLKLLLNGSQPGQQTRAEVLQMDARDYLTSLTQDPETNPEENQDQSQPRFDLIFLDPPFRQNWLPEILTLITHVDLLADDGLIYLEREDSVDADLDPEIFGLTVLKSTHAGQVISQLLAKTG